MRHDLRTVVVPFPKGLMSTARSPLTMPAKFARDVRNMLMAADGAGTKRNGVVTVGAALGAETVLGLMSFQHSTGMQLLAVTDAGKIYRLNAGSWVQVYSGLSTTGTPRSVSFAGRLLLCNGVDELLAWDGSSWTVVSTFVKDAGANLTFLSTTQFRIDSTLSLYAVGSRVRAKVGASFVEANVTAASLSGVQVTVTLDAAVLAAGLSEVWFTVKPPRLAFLGAAHDRLWGFGKGPLSNTPSADVDRMRVYYTFGVNNWQSWPDPATGTIPSLNLADKAGVSDELLGMDVKDGMTIFFGRNHMQLWTGVNPQAGGDFGWSKTLPLGVVHGNAVIQLPNDVLFVSRQGARTLSRSLQTEQLDVGDVGGELDPTVSALITQLSTDAAAYRRLVTFQQEGQGWFGLSGPDQTLVWQIGSFGSGWVIFDGVFAGLTAAHAALDGNLYVAKGAQVFRYDTTTWSDAGTAFTTRWWLPWLNPAGTSRWANKYVELLVAPGNAQQLVLRRYRDFDDVNPRVMSVAAPERPDNWDTANWDSASWDAGQTAPALVRDHTVLASVSLAVESLDATSGLTIFGCKLIGLPEQA